MTQDRHKVPEISLTIRGRLPLLIVGVSVLMAFGVPWEKILALFGF